MQNFLKLLKLVFHPNYPNFKEVGYIFFMLLLDTFLYFPSGSKSRKNKTCLPVRNYFYIFINNENMFNDIESTLGSIHHGSLDAAILDCRILSQPILRYVRITLRKIIHTEVFYRNNDYSADIPVLSC